MASVLISTLQEMSIDENINVIIQAEVDHPFNIPNLMIWYIIHRQLSF